MAVIEEIDEEAERIDDEKKRQQARRKAAVAAGGNLGPNGPSLEKAKPAFARGFLNSARPKGNSKQTDQGPIKDASSGSPSEKLSDQKQDKNESGGGNEGGKLDEFERTHENVEPQTGSGEGEKRVGEVIGEAPVSNPEALENSKEESVKSTTMCTSKSASKGLAKGFLNFPPKAALQTTSTGTSMLQHGKGIPLVDGSAQKTKVHGSSSAQKVALDAKTGKEETLHVGTAVNAGGTAAVIGTESRAEEVNNGLITEKVKAPMGMKLNGGARHLDLDDTWSVETQTSDTDKSELQEEVASALSRKARVTGAVPQTPGEAELSVEAPKDGLRGVVELGPSGNAPETESQSLEKSRSAVSMREVSEGQRGGELEEKQGQGSEEGKRGASVVEEQEGGIEEKGGILPETGGVKEEEGEKGGAGLQLAEGTGDKAEETEGKGIEAMNVKEEEDDQKKGVGAELEERKEAGGNIQKDAEKDGHEAVVQEEMDEKVASGEEGEVEDFEEEFHDACEDEEQQRKQALARAEEARARGNALYAAADYNGALEVYSQALELAPPAYVTVEKSSVDDAKQSEAEESETLKGTSSGNVAEGVEPEGTGGGGSDRGSSSDTDRLVSLKGLGEGSSPPEGSGFRTGAAWRVRPPKVLDPKTGKLVVPDEKSAESGDGASASERVGGGMETGAKAGGGEEQREDQEAISCRAACHANRAACFVQLGLHEAVVRECNEALKLKPDYVKVSIRRAQAFDKLDKQEEALADWKTVLEKDPSNRHARMEIRRLEPIVTEKREKMKEEMLGKLKDLGNSVLGHFGLSVDNFKAVQDPKTGGYSINFSK